MCYMCHDLRHNICKYDMKCSLRQIFSRKRTTRYVRHIQHIRNSRFEPRVHRIHNLFSSIHCDRQYLISKIDIKEFYKKLKQLDLEIQPSKVGPILVRPLPGGPFQILRFVLEISTRNPQSKNI